MKRIKISLIAAIALGALMVCTTVGNAQPSDDKGEKKGPPGGRKGMPTVEQQLEKMTKELSLTDDQKPKVKEVIEENRKKMQELFASAQGGGDRAAMREKRQAISDDQDKKLKAILKPDQYEKWEKMRDKMREEMRKGKKGGSDGEKKSEGEKKD